MVIRITVEESQSGFIHAEVALFRIQGANTSFYNYPPAIKARLLEKGLQHRRSWMHMKKNRVFGFRGVSMEI